VTAPRSAGRPADAPTAVADRGAGDALRDLLAAADAAILLFDPRGRLSAFTAQAARRFDLSDADGGLPAESLGDRLGWSTLAADLAALRDGGASARGSGGGAPPGATLRAAPGGGAVATLRDGPDRDALSAAAELDALQRHGPFGLSFMDRDLRWRRINDRLAAINGFPASAHLGRAQRELIPTIDAETVAIQRRALDTGEPALGVAVRGTTPASPGEEREWLVDYIPVRIDGAVAGLACCVREVTHERALERGLAREAARAAGNEARLARLFDQAPAAIALHEGPEHVYAYANAAHRLAVGDRAEIGRPLRAARPELADEGASALYDRVYATGRPVSRGEVAAPVDRGDGAGPRPGLWREMLQPWLAPDGSVRGVMSFAHEITDEVRARREVREGRERLQRVIDSLAAFVGLLTPDGVLVEANLTAVRRAGLRREDVIGKPFWDCWWWSWDRGVQDRLRDACRRAAAGEEVTYEETVRLADDARILIDFRLAPIRDDSGAVVAIVPSAIDVTERRRAEQRKDMLLAELQHRVKNVLATVQSVAHFVARVSDDKDALVEGLRDRLAAIARAHDALTAREWRPQTLRSLVAAEVEAFVAGGRGRVTYRGADVALGPSDALAMAMAIHELVTNALKHGALSAPTGAVEVRVEAGEDGEPRTVTWRESGGPPVAPPARRGFGSFLLTRVLARELDAEVRLEHSPDGLRCEIAFRPAG
jgi:two-component system CheB/CheR fusion protein